MGNPQGFDYSEQRDGTVLITHHGRRATVLRGDRAEQFLEEVECHPQRVMARWTGNYKRGNERVAKRHPRNAGR
ncbi:MAG: hypothetical protein ACTII7_10885 [Galactobacter sp.]